MLVIVNVLKMKRKFPRNGNYRGHEEREGLLTVHLRVGPGAETSVTGS